MFREIKKKQLILENRKPYNREVLSYMDEMNQVDWIYSTMKLDGSRITKAEVQKIIKGEFLEDVAVGDHSSVSTYLELIRMAYDMAGMSIDLNEKYLFNLYMTLAKSDKPEYRRTNPVLLAFAYNPPHPSEIEEQMEILFHWLYSGEFDTNPILKAAYLHNKLIEIYPFETQSEGVARAAMYYELIRSGYPPVQFNLSEQEYHTAVIRYLKNDEIQPIYEPLERSVFNKLEIMIQLTSE